MNIEEIKAYLESNKDQEEVKTYVEELSAVSPEKVKGFLDTEDGKRILQPKLDQYHAKSLESWKTNNLGKLVDEEVKKRNPDKSPAEIALEKLQKQFDDSEKARTRETLKNKALTTATDKKLPTDILDFFIADDEDATNKNLSKLETSFQTAVQSAVDSKFKDNGRDVNAGNGPGSTGIKSIQDMAAAHNIRNQQGGN